MKPQTTVNEDVQLLYLEFHYSQRMLEITYLYSSVLLYYAQLFEVMMQWPDVYEILRALLIKYTVCVIVLCTVIQSDDAVA